MGKNYKRFRAGISLIVLSLLIGAGIASAESPPAPTPGGSTLETRVAQRKAERGTNLNQDDTQRMVGACVNAQVKLRSIQNKESQMLENRDRVYNGVDGKLWVVIGQLKLARRDTFELEKQHQAVIARNNNFRSIANSYKQTLDDLLLINCKADPNGFKALLDTARIYYDQLRTQSTDTEEYVINTVKSTLKTHSSELQLKAAADEAEDQ